jgi:hypothetical protein
LCGGQRGFRRAQPIEFVFRVEFGQHLACLDAVADIDRSFDHSPADAKGKSWLVFSPDVPGQHHCFGCFSFGRHHRADGANLRCFDLRVRLT